MNFARLVALAGFVIGVRYYVELWIFDPNGLSRLSDRLPYWDFTNLWAGTRIALEGHVGWLFGFDVWPQFIQHTGPLMTQIMQAPYPQLYLAHLPNFQGIGLGILIPFGLAMYGMRETLARRDPQMLKAA